MAKSTRDRRLERYKIPAVRCKAHSSRTGQPCKQWAIRGAVVCVTHGGSAPNVKRAAAERVAEALEDLIAPSRILREIAAIAYFDMRRLYDSEGNLLKPKDWPDDVARALSSMKTVKKNLTTGDGKVDDVIEPRLWDKPKALELLAKHKGLLTDKVEVSLGADLFARLTAGRKRVADGK